MDNGPVDTKNVVTITVFPSKDGFGCTVTEPKMSPLTQEFSVALTIAHGMVRMALQRPDIIFDEGVESLTHPEELYENTVVSIDDIVNKRKRRLH
jgi:hypothetical protein